MALEARERDRLRGEIRRMKPEPEDFKSDDDYRDYHDMLDEKVRALYCAVANTTEWTLVEFLDPETLTQKWYWRRKS